MTIRKQKLELTWIGKENRPRLEPRILLEDQEKSYHAKHRVTDKDIFNNQLIFGDNPLALKALEAEFTGKVKCVFIDPPSSSLDRIMLTSWTILRIFPPIKTRFCSIDICLPITLTKKAAARPDGLFADLTQT